MSKKKDVKLAVGMTVKVKKQQGTIAFLGKTKFAPGDWIGIILDNPEGKNNGTVKDVAYFTCEPKYGLFAKAKMVKIVAGGKASGKKPKKEKKGSTKSKKKDKGGKKEKKPKGGKKEAPAKKEKEKPKPKKESKPASVAKEKVVAAKAKKEAVAQGPADSAALKTLENQVMKLEDKLEAADRQIAALEQEVEEAKEEVEAAKSAPPPNTEAKDGDSSEVTSLKGQIEKLSIEKEQIELECESKLEEMEVDKELLDLKATGLEDELAVIMQEMEDTQLELENLELEKEEWLDGLDPDAADTQQLADEKRKLAAALRQLKDKYDNEKDEADLFKEEALEKLSKYKQMEDDIIRLTDEVAEKTEAIDDFQQQIDEAGSHEEELEELNEKNLDLDQKIEDLQAKIEYHEQMKEANEEMIEQQDELSSQLQADLDQREMEMDEITSQLSLKLKQVEDLHATQRKFKDHVKHLEAEVLETRSAMNRQGDEANAGDQEYRQQRKANQQLQSRVSEVRGKTVDYVRAKIDKEEFASKMRFYEMHIPDNLDVDQAAIQLILILDRLKGKAIEGANLLGEFYGKETHNESLANSSYDLCGKLLELAKNIATLRRCIERCDDDETFAVVVGERNSLTTPEETIDDLLSLIHRDEFDIEYSKEGIEDAQENIVGFVAAHFMTDEDDRGNRRLKSPAPLRVWLDCKKLYFQQELISTYFQCLEDLFEMVPTVDDKPNSFEDMFDKLKQLCKGNEMICKTMLNQSQVYQMTCENRPNVSGAGFAGPIKSCSQAIFGCGVRVKEILESFNSVFSRTPPDETNREYFVSQIEARLDAETSEDRLASRLQSTQTILKELSEKLDNVPDADGSGTKTIPLWEQNAHQVRQQLLEAANLKSALEEAQTKVEERDRALFKTRKDAQDKQAQIDVLQARWDATASKMGEQGELEQEVEKLRKRVKQQQDASDVIVKDLSKYQSKNKVLRQKVLKLKVELKAARVNGGGGGVGGEGVPILSGKSVNSLKMATHEIDLLVRTISSMRDQLAQVRCAQITRNLNASLPLLPIIWGGAHIVHSTSSSTVDATTAVETLKSFMPSPFYGDTKNDAVTTQNLSTDLCNLATRVTAFRAAPKLVDISKTGKEVEVSPGQQWLSRQEEAQKLKNDSTDFNKKLQVFLDSKRNHAFRSMFSSLAAPEAAVLGQQSLGQLVGKVTIPSVNPGSNEKVTIDRNNLSRLHDILVN